VSDDSLGATGDLKIRSASPARGYAQRTLRRIMGAASAALSLRRGTGLDSFGVVASYT
jgi:hypothetical protein